MCDAGSAGACVMLVLLEHRVSSLPFLESIVLLEVTGGRRFRLVLSSDSGSAITLAQLG